MAFSNANLALIFVGGAGRAKRWSYITTDTLPTVQASGYFDSTVSAMLDIGDTIDVTVVDAVAPASRAAVSGVVSLVVAGISGTTVTTTQDSVGAIGKIVATTATTLTVTAALHADRTVVVNSAAPIAITLPQALGTGNKYRFFVGVVATGTAHTIKVANATDVLSGYALCVTTTTDNAEGFKTTATDDTISINGTTKGGVVGDVIEIEDVATGVFSVQMRTAPTGTEATPFSATV